ncbi:alpha/beta hydrolase [Comamonas thiooxydans]|uniref:alpha/beta hydrolase n=1 Tax=Comamonas thiooxydans TaxID=363952 RepID=UPI002113C1E2|nr:lipase family protein [Comamonas thiooxydans]UUE94510.1 alpha/beta hydrolase [Comamonas thiooxydans]
MKSALRSLALAACLVTATAGAQTPVSDPLWGDGRVSDFYTWSEAIPSTPGVPLRKEPLPTPLGLAGAGAQFRVLYGSTSGVDGKTPVAVSGAVFVPKGEAPAEGWPIVAWAHGTVGVADALAPSWHGRSYRDVQYLNAWLNAGFAVVATDYEGLGVAGLHPYMDMRSEAYSVLDSVRAALKNIPLLSNRIVIVGQSQGAGAAFATAGFAPQYAPDLHILGTVATGVPYPTSDVRAAAQFYDQKGPLGSYMLYTVLTAMEASPGLKASDVLTDKALPLLDLARIKHIALLQADIDSVGLTWADSFKPGGLAKIWGRKAAEYPTFKLQQPLFVGSGTIDLMAPPQMQRRLVQDACKAGTIVEVHLYPGLGHDETVNASLKDSIPFVRKLLAGQPIAPICEP